MDCDPTARFYSDPSRETDPHALADCEVWLEDDGLYYYWFCFSGCLPESDPIGPFDSPSLAIDDARSHNEQNESGPEVGDFVLSDSGPLGSLFSVSVVEGWHVGEYASRDDAMGAIRQQMDKEQFYPAVWQMSDHGNMMEIGYT